MEVMKQLAMMNNFKFPMLLNAYRRLSNTNLSQETKIGMFRDKPNQRINREVKIHLAG